MIARRRLLLAASALCGLSVVGCGRPPKVEAGGDEAFANDPIRQMSDEEWRSRLGDGLTYAVLRHEATEAPGSSPLLEEHRKGGFYCAGCDLALFESGWKFESGTGWPSFFDVIKDNIGTKTDNSIVIEPRTEYHCARCLGHQGHVFPDGPRPTGLRYCNNGAALVFKAG